MISRRLIRTKILQTLYASLQGDKTINHSEKELLFSMGKVEELYYYILLLLIEIIHYDNTKIEAAKEKKIPTYADLHPNTKFINNRLIKQIADDPGLKKYILKTKISWSDHPELIKSLHRNVTSSEYYLIYMNDLKSEYAQDKKMVENILCTEIARMDQLELWMEEKSVFWNDDIGFVLSLVAKNLKKLKESDDQLPSMGKFKNEEDKDFAIRLFRNSILNYEEYKQLIEKYTTNWDVDRIAFMDILLMVLAITEIIEFPTIPVKVSLNEYIEIAKTYSTKNSSNFINGILDKILKVLREEKKFFKQGRGLVGEE